MVKKERERDLWLSIDYNFMTDESEVETKDHGTSIVKHALLGLRLICRHKFKNNRVVNLARIILEL